MKNIFSNVKQVEIPNKRNQEDETSCRNRRNWLKTTEQGLNLQREIKKVLMVSICGKQ